jgi:hypothetical protein
MSGASPAVSGTPDPGICRLAHERARKENTMYIGLGTLLIIILLIVLLA